MLKLLAFSSRGLIYIYICKISLYVNIPELQNLKSEGAQLRVEAKI